MHKRGGVTGIKSMFYVRVISSTIARISRVSMIRKDSSHGTEMPSSFGINTNDPSGMPLTFVSSSVWLSTVLATSMTSANRLSCIDSFEPSGRNTPLSVLPESFINRATTLNPSGCSRLIRRPSSKVNVAFSEENKSCFFLFDIFVDGTCLNCLSQRLERR